MLKRLLLFSLLLFNFHFLLSAQTDSSHVRVSLLTCGPGEDLYSTFGHSALRITDTVSGDDIVFNYGTFDFREPGFYIKFIRGKLMYYLSTEDFASFRDFYQQENRSMFEQVLQLTPLEKSNIIEVLEQNLESKNRYYKYDFTFDNCTTRLRDLIEKSADSTVIYGSVLPQKKRFRQLIYEYLDYNDKQWSKLGIDLLLGAKTDAVMTSRQVMFLPDYLRKTLERTTIGTTPVVLSSQNLYQVSAQKGKINYISHPEFLFTVLLMIVVMLSFSKNNSVKKFISNLDGLIFFITGLMGILILIMWFATDHIMCSNNFNLLWAWPTHTFAAFYVNSKKAWVKNYFKLTAFVNLVLLVLWFFLPQHMNISFIPLVMIFIFRSTIIAYSFKRNIN